MRVFRFISGGIFIFVLIFVFHCGKSQQSAVTLTSPDKSIQIDFCLNKTSDGITYPCYTLSFNGKLLLKESELGIEFAGTGLLKNNLEIQTIEYADKDETYPVLNGKTKTARNHYNEATITLKETSEPFRQFDLLFRAYNDGAAFRYNFPKQERLSNFVITSENSCFSLTGNPIAYILPLGKFTTSYENNYDTIPLKKITPDSIIGLPILFEYPEELYAAITEANLTDYAGMYLSGTDHAGTLKSVLAPLPGNPTIKVKASTPHSSPWRVIMIGKNMAALIESNIILNLNEPCAIPDPSWIKPGKVAFLWWNDFVVTDVDFKGGVNTKTMKYYIDFCAENNLQFIHIDTDDKIDWYGTHDNKNVDITKPIPALNMEKVMRHAKSKGIGVVLWLQWQVVRGQMDKAFPVYEKWGISGLKIDYMNRDDQEMVNFYHAAVKKAAEHHLTVNFHGAYKPTGIRRTYPNLITREGVLGLEYSKWSARCDPEHELMIPFTRMLAGPMDFTPGAFHTTTREQFKPLRHAPMAMGTRCHQLAMYVVYESPRQMVSDYPAAYKNQTGFDFIRQVPTVWDETKVLNAKVGDYIIIARKHGNEWYVGSMTDWTARDLQISLNFLPEGNFIADIYSDGQDADKIPTQVIYQQLNITAKSIITAKLAPGGGHAIRIVSAP